MTEAIEQEEVTEPQTTTPEQQLAIVKQQKQERLNVLAANDPIYQRLVGFDRLNVLAANDPIYQRLVGQDDNLTALPSTNGKVVPDDA